MRPTLALDIYGTLIDPLAIRTELEGHIGEQAADFAQTWRTKQLEYTFRRGLMGVYQNFQVVTREALDFSCATFGIDFDDQIKSKLMQKYRSLEAFADAAPALASLKEKGVSLHAFSNGMAEDIAELLHRAGLDDKILSIVSVDEVGSFKPDPRVYDLFSERTGAPPEKTWLVSSNPFDIIGASACGWQTAWVKRTDKSIFDPWEFSPTTTITNLNELASAPSLLTTM